MIWSPAFTSALVRTADPVTYPLSLCLAAVLTHAGTLALCLRDWRQEVKDQSLWRVISSTIDSFFHIGPRGSFRPSEPEGIAVSVLAFLSLTFGTFTALAVFAPFPLATVPSLLGKRLARAFGAWLWLTSVVLYSLQDSRKAGLTIKPNSSVRLLARGVRDMCAAHLGVGLMRVLLETSTVYPAAFACLPAVVASVVIYALAFIATGMLT